MDFTRDDRLPLDFAKRFEEQIKKWERERRWGYVVAGSQHGKTTSIRHLYLEAGPFKRHDGVTHTPIAVGIASGGQPHHLLSTIAFSLAGELALYQPRLSSRIPQWMADFGTRLVIISDAHNLAWSEWKLLITLHETMKSLYGVEMPFVFSGVTGNVGVIDSERRDPVSTQLVERLGRIARIEGHRGKAVKEALDLIARRDASDLAPSLAKLHDLVEKLLTAHEFDPGRLGVASRHLVELTHNVAAIRVRHPDESMEALIDRAVRKIRRDRRLFRPGTGEAA